MAVMLRSFRDDPAQINRPRIYQFSFNIAVENATDQCLIWNPRPLRFRSRISKHCSIQPDPDEGLGRTLLLSEHWENEAALSEHIRPDIYRPVLSAAELSSTTPEIRFHRVSDTRDLEEAEEINVQHKKGDSIYEKDDAG